MCGLVAFYEPHNVVEADRLQAAVAALHHRGPDGQRCWQSADRRVGLAHARLAIIGLSDGPQPVSNEDGTIQAVVNGEFYDFERIRKELETRGHRFQTQTDSEILVHLYEEHGVDCLKFLRGEFAFVLWDEARQRIFAARDRFGIKPLVYARTESGGIIFASEAKALFAAGLKAAWDRESMYHALHLQYTLPDRTLFKGVFQIKPGQCAIIDPTASSFQTYWDLEYPCMADRDAEAGSDEDLIEGFQHKLVESIKLRLRADTPVCCHLSGGLDSASIAGIAAKLSSQPLHCFSVTFEEAEYDEFPIAQQMAAHIGANFHPVLVSQQDILEGLGDAVFYSEGLAVNGHLTAKHLLHKAISKAGLRVGLSGEGSDELLAGYAHLRLDLLQEKGRADLLGSLARSNSASTGIMLREGKMLDLSAVKDRLAFVPNYLEAKASLGFKLSSVASDGFLRSFAGRDCYDELMDAIDVDTQLRGRERINQSTYVWMKTALANYILRTLGDGTEMASSVEGRVPFLDHELFEHAKRLPVDIKIRGTREKFILREAVKQHVTEEIYSREKHPFVAPPLSRFADERATTLLRDQVNSKSFQSVPFFDQKKLLLLLDKLPTLSTTERAAYDPVFMTALSAHALQTRLHL